jgi:5'-nucleotidase
MRILISNDDGIDAPGLAALEAAARLVSKDVWVIAPSGNRSGFGHSITLRTAFTVKEVAAQRYSCTGTPADCVIAGISWVFRDRPRPDLVLSGINEGRNVAEDVSYSGTMAVAREAALWGIPGIAFSTPRDAVPMEDAATRWLAERIQAFWTMRSQWANEGHWLSVNLPRRMPAPMREARIGRDKVATMVVIHREDASSADIEPLAARNYFSTHGDENNLIDSGVASVTCLNWMGSSAVPASVLHELDTALAEGA